MRFAALAALSFVALAVPSSAQQAPASPAKPPRLLVVISVDQFSADLFSEYRARFTGGLARLQQGGVFPSGYQSHSATETCPGHSTILTGDHPARTGIVANDWIDLNAARADKTVYCAEDESVAGSTSSDYTVSDTHLLVPTLGERMKAANPATRVVSVAGKDRAAVMMGGHKVDELWWWDGKRFRSYAGRAEPGAVTRTNRAVTARLAEAQPATPMIDACADRSRAIAVKDGLVMGAGRFARAAGDARAFALRPEFDAAVLALSTALIYDMKLGQGPTTDIISIGASATDYIGHGYGTQGSEMCLQLMALDASLGDFMTRLDATGVDYMVVLTADHGGLDMAERSRMEGAPDAQRIAKSFDRDAIAKAANAAAGTPEGSVVFNGSEIYLDGKLTGAQRAKLTGLLVAAIARQPQVADVFTRAQIEAAAAPAGTARKLVDHRSGQGEPLRAALGRSLCRVQAARDADRRSGSGLCRDAWQRVGLRSARADAVLAQGHGGVRAATGCRNGRYRADAGERDRAHPGAGRGRWTLPRSRSWSDDDLSLSGARGG